MPLALGLATSGNARAQSADAAQSSSSGTPAESADIAKTLPAVKVQGTADVLPGDRASAYGGGQVAGGASFGVLGEQIDDRRAVQHDDIHGEAD